MKPALSALALIALSAPAAAQEAGTQGDWDLVREGLSVSAVLGFEPAPNFIVRCSRDRLDVLITGLPPASADTLSRPIEMRWDDDEPTKPNWQPLSSKIVASRFPAWHARMLRQGGSLRMLVRSEADQPGSEYRLDIPPSPGAIDTVLEACDTPLTDARDALMREAVDPALALAADWSRRPTPVFPQAAQSAGIEAGTAQLLCQVSPEGRFSSCEVQSEFPPGGGFGEASVASMRNARLAPGSVVPADGQTSGLFTPMLRYRIR